MLASRTKRGLALTAAALAATLAAAAILAPHGRAGETAANLKLRVAALACGDTVTVSTKLATDLTCAGNGLTVAGTHVVLDLGGHTVTGGTTYGIFVSGRGDTVQNGTVEGFTDGVYVDFAAVGAKVQGIRAIDEGTHGILSLADGVVVSGNSTADAGTGIRVSAGVHTTITNNWARSNNVGISVGSSASGTVVTGNRAVSNTTGGIAVAADLDGTVVSGNVANSNGGAGIATSGVGNVSVGKNVASFNTGLGLDVGYRSTDAGGNHAVGNTSAHQCENVVCS
jgi:parallel beta-helix repeat protein